MDLVITDVAMPIMNGPEHAEQVSRLRPGLPVLFISGYTDDEMVRRGLIEPDHPFLSKPFSPEVLASRFGKSSIRAPAERVAAGDYGHPSV